MFELVQRDSRLQVLDIFFGADRLGLADLTEKLGADDRSQNGHDHNNRHHFNQRKTPSFFFSSSYSYDLSRSYIAVVLRLVTAMSMAATMKTDHDEHHKDHRGLKRGQGLV